MIGHFTSYSTPPFSKLAIDHVDPYSPDSNVTGVLRCIVVGVGVVLPPETAD
jgi:hypothetical protein